MLTARLTSSLVLSSEPPPWECHGRGPRCSLGLPGNLCHPGWKVRAQGTAPAPHGPSVPPPGVPCPQELLVSLRHPVGPAEQLHPQAEEDVGRSFQVGRPLSAGAPPGGTRDPPQATEHCPLSEPGTCQEAANPEAGLLVGGHPSKCPLALGQHLCPGTQFPYLSSTRQSHTGDFPVFPCQPHHSVPLKSKPIQTEPHTWSSPPPAHRAPWAQQNPG